ncbi:MAG: hypothetical protein AB2A00_06000 [Myxococcota bacterium]
MAASLCMGASLGSGDLGTRLTATAEASPVECTSLQSGVVGISGILETTGSADSAVIRVAVDGGSPVQMGTIQPQDFVHNGRIKTANYALELSLANGSHVVQVCFEQSGAQGRLPKSVCATPVSVEVQCNVCAGARPFGNIVGNNNLCKANGHIPVSVRGDFGDDATLEIQGPNGFVHQAAMNHAGQSCNYHYNWNPNDGNGGAGSYTFRVQGNGQKLVFGARLNCR